MGTSWSLASFLTLHANIVTDSACRETPWQFPARIPFKATYSQVDSSVFTVQQAWGSSIHRWLRRSVLLGRLFLKTYHNPCKLVITSSIYGSYIAFRIGPWRLHARVQLPDLFVRLCLGLKLCLITEQSARELLSYKWASNMSLLAITKRTILLQADECKLGCMAYRYCLMYTTRNHKAQPR